MGEFHHDQRKEKSSRTQELSLADEISTLRGTFYGVAGTLTALGIGFLANLILARNLGAEAYGVWSLALLTMVFANMISSMGLRQGVSRFIGKYRGSDAKEKISSIIRTSISLILPACLLISTIFFIISPQIAHFFDIPSLSGVLRIISWSIIPSGILGIVISIFKGYENIRLAEVIDKFIRSSLWLGSIGILLAVGFNLRNVSIAYLIMNLSVTGIAILFFIRDTSSRVILRTSQPWIGSVSKFSRPLLAFSIPLLFSGFLNYIKSQTDTFMIAYFLTAREVGVYTVAFRIASLSPFFLNAVISIFMPVISKNLSKGDYSQVNDLYIRVTKWSFTLTLVIILTLFIFSNFFLGWFGEEYLGASAVLKLLLITYLVHTLTGPNGATNIALGDTKFVASYTLIGASSNVALNWFLIPIYGVEGAALASVVSVFLMNTIASAKLHIINKITPFRRKYNYFVGFSLSLGMGIGVFIKHFVVSGGEGAMLFLVIFLFFEIFMLKKLNFIDEKDRALLERIRIKGVMILKNSMKIA